MHKHLPVDVKVTKFSYFRAAGKYKDMRTHPYHVFMIEGGNGNFKDCVNVNVKSFKV